MGSAQRARAFSVIELVLVIVIIMSLFALALPMLGSTREEAKRLETISKLRQHAGVIAMYAGDHRDLLPAYTDPDATQTVLRVGGRVFLLRGYFDGKSLWHAALADMYYDGLFGSEVFGPRGYYQGTIYSPFWITLTSRARDAFWDPETRGGREQFKAMGISDVRFPSAKGLFWDRTANGRMYSPELGRSEFLDPPERRRHPTAFFDGRAGSFRPHQFGPFMIDGVGWWNPWTHPTNAASPVVHTIGGLGGRDVVD